jgi:hypothetical protein
VADLFLSYDSEREPGDRLAPEVVDEICLISSQDVCGGGGGDSAIYERFENKGQINGYAALDGTARLPAAQLPLAAIEYKGTWNASSNTPTLSNGAGNLGDIYRVSEAGNSLGFPVEVGDVVFYDGTAWFKLGSGSGGGGGAVDSVNGQTGVVVLTKADIGLPLADNTADATKAVLSATKLVPGRKINGVAFDGTADITVPISSTDPALTAYQLKSEKGVNNGYASLDAAGKLPSSQLSLSALEYKGVWDAATNTPPLAAGVGTPGDMWRVNVSGTQFGVKFTAGDFALFNGTSWENATSGTAGVSSVAGLTGDVATAALKAALAYTMAELTDVTPVGLAVGTAADEAAARDAIDAETTLAKGKPGGYAPLDARSIVPLENLPNVAVLDADGNVPAENLPDVYAASIVDSSEVGRAVVTAADELAARDATNTVGRGDLVASVLDYGVTGDGVTNDRVAIQAVIDQWGGVRDIFFPPGRYRLGDTGGTGSNRVVLKSGTSLQFATGAVIEVNQVDNPSGTSIFYAAGTQTSTPLAADLTAGSVTVAVPSAAGLSVGDVIGFDSRALTGTVATSGADYYTRELHAVTAISGDTVTLDFPLEFSYLVADSANFFTVNTVDDITIDGAVFESGPGVTPGTSNSYAIRIDKARNVTIRNVQLRNMIGGINLIDVYGGFVTDCTIDGLPKYSNWAGYGVSCSGGSTHITVNNLHGRNTRHVFTTLSLDDLGYYSGQYGGPMHITVSNGIGFAAPGSYSVWDTHPYGRHILFDNCVAVGGGTSANGFQVRAQDVTLNNCRAYDNGARGVSALFSSKRVRVTGGQFTHCGSNGVAVDGEDSSVANARINDNALSGISISAQAKNLSVTGCVVRRNLNYGIQFLSPDPRATSVTIRDCVIPKEGSQNNAMLGASSTTVITNTACPGWGSGTGMISTVAGARWQILTDNGYVSNETFDSTMLKSGGVQVETKGHTHVAADVVGALSWTTTVPGTPSAAGTRGMFTADGQFLYVCVTSGAAGAAAWKRLAFEIWV